MNRLRVMLAALFLLGGFGPMALAEESWDGVWDGWVVEGRGDKPGNNRVHLQLTIKGDTIVGKQINDRGDQDMGAGTFTLGNAKVREMDAARTVAAGGGPGGGPGGPGGRRPGRNENYKGIVSVDGDTMKWCVANPGRDRPKDFETLRENSQFLVILKKQKAAK